MLRLETKQTGTRIIKRAVDGGREGPQTIVETETPLYANRIKETFAFLPRNHYITLLSVHVPFKPYQDSISLIYYLKVQGKWTKKLHVELKELGSPEDICDLFVDTTLETRITNKRFQFVTSIPVSGSSAGADAFMIQLSPHTAWLLGFNQTVYRKNLSEKITADIVRPPIFTRYLQILCHNVGGTRDSNMTFPEAIAIYPLVSSDTLFTPNVAVSHRLEKGKVLDIEILDQDNQPFKWAPVYLELYITEGSEHEKKQGFFRIDQTTTLVLAEPVSRISIPYVHAFHRIHLLAKRLNFLVRAKVAGTQPTYLTANFSDLRNCSLTRGTLIQIIVEINKAIYYKYQINKLYLRAHFDQNVLVLSTNLESIDIANSFLNDIAYLATHQHKIIITKGSETRVEIKPEYLFTKDQRLLIFCKEFSDAEPIAVCRHNKRSFRLLNPHFWTWYQLEKPTNTLTFRYQIQSNYDDGLTNDQEILPKDSDFLVNLFYK
mgnify:CR=1 FL=1